MSQNTPSLTTAPRTTTEEKLARKAIPDIAAAGRFSSDRTIAEYARELWQVKPCRVEAP